MFSRLRDEALDVAFAIGGPDGHGDSLKAAAHFQLSLGRMTLPHGLARIVLTEQLYRAVTIMQGHPYHRG
jgi:23S rRNA (pseudouridine1915-N3)-methyltransferase